MAAMLKLIVLLAVILVGASCHHIPRPDGTNGYVCFCERDNCGTELWDPEINQYQVRKCDEQMCRTTTATKANGDVETFRGCPKALNGSFSTEIGCKNETLAGYESAVTCNCNLTDLCNFVKSGVTRVPPPPSIKSGASGISLPNLHVASLVSVLAPAFVFIFIFVIMINTHAGAPSKGRRQMDADCAALGRSIN